MRKYVMVLALAVAPVHAADFRTLDIGNSCASVQALEEAQGSVEIPWQEMEGGELYAFRTQDLDRELIALYFCFKGHLFAGNYYFPIESLEDAAKSYRRVQELLISRYGAPFIDTSPGQADAAPRDPRLVVSDPRKYYTSWRTSRLAPVMSIQPSLEPGTSGWRVFVVVSGRLT
jgi:hypothetical protein